MPTAGSESDPGVWCNLRSLHLGQATTYSVNNGDPEGPTWGRGMDTKEKSDGTAAAYISSDGPRGPGAKLVCWKILPRVGNGNGTVSNYNSNSALKSKVRFVIFLIFPLSFLFAFEQSPGKQTHS